MARSDRARLSGGRIEAPARPSPGPGASTFGFSNGGQVGMQLAIRHPRAVRRLIVASAAFRRDVIRTEHAVLLASLIPYPGRAFSPQMR